MSSLIQEKVQQAVGILQEFDVDVKHSFAKLWLIGSVLDLIYAGDTHLA
jgi:hypothetical protein